MLTWLIFTLTESTGYITQCSKTPAIEPAAKQIKKISTSIKFGFFSNCTCQSCGLPWRRFLATIHIRQNRILRPSFTRGDTELSRAMRFLQQFMEGKTQTLFFFFEITWCLLFLIPYYSLPPNIFLVSTNLSRVRGPHTVKQTTLLKLPEAHVRLEGKNP